jgi:type IV secretion system protein TrbC
MPARILTVAGITSLGIAQRAEAQILTLGRGMPWDGWLQALLANITGPTLRAIAVLMLILASLALATSDGGGFRKLINLAFALSIAFAAATWGPAFFGYVGP